MPMNQLQDEELKKFLMDQQVPHGTSDQLNDPRVQDSNPGHKPQDLMGAETNQKMASIDQYGPDQQKAVYDNVIKSQGSFGNRVARAGAGLGDAIMGVADKSGPGFLNSLEGREKNQQQIALNEIPTLGKMNMENMGAKEHLEEKNPTSTLSRAAQIAYEGIFQKMGYPPGSTKNKSAAEIRTIAALGAQMHGNELEDAVKAAELKLNSQRVNAQIANDTEQSKIKKTESEQKALNQLGGMSWYNRLLHPGISNKLEEQAGFEEKEKPIPGISSQADYDSLPAGSEYMANGVKHRKK